MDTLQRHFGYVWGASGVQNYFGEGYWFHNWLLGPDFRGMTFVGKTTTLGARLDPTICVPMKHDAVTPAERFPKRVVIKPFKGVMLNAWGLSGPGAADLIYRGEWQKRRDPFLLSFMSVAKTPEERLEELQVFCDLLSDELRGFRAHYLALQINLSCPNVGLDPSKLLHEADQSLNIASILRIPVLVKINALVPAQAAAEIAQHRQCAGLCTSNALPYGVLPDRIDWVGLFGSMTSPLKKRCGANGGLSGRPLLPLVCQQIREIRNLGCNAHINGGGGILEPVDVDAYLAAGASSVALGCIAALRPWNVQRTIRRANVLFGARYGGR